jgi:hypothetical protein
MNDWEYDNGAENHEMYDVCVLVRDGWPGFPGLLERGYRVNLTKTGPDDIVSKRARVNVAIINNADLFASVHRDAHTFGTWGHVYVQRVNDWRYDVNGVKKYFTLADVAAESKRIGDAILKARKTIEGSAITMAVQNYTGRGGNIPGGNLTITQLWNTRPALLLEAGVCNTEAKKQKYAQGIVNGIIAALPIGGTVTPPTPPVITHTVYDNKDSHIIKTGTWATFTKAEAYKGSYQRSSTKGATATIKFNGTRIDYVGMKGTTLGLVDIYLDGTRMATYNLNASVATYQVIIWSSGNLVPGTHTLKIVRNSVSSTGKFITIDSVDIWGNML